MAFDPSAGPQQFDQNYFVMQQNPGTSYGGIDEDGNPIYYDQDGDRIRSPLGNDFDLNQAQLGEYGRQLANSGLVQVGPGQDNGRYDALIQHGVDPLAYYNKYYGGGGSMVQIGDKQFYKAADPSFVNNPQNPFDLGWESPDLAGQLVLAGLGMAAVPAVGAGLASALSAPTLAGNVLASGGLAGLEGGDPATAMLSSGISGAIPNVTGVSAIDNAIKSASAAAATGGDPLAAAVMSAGAIGATQLGTMTSNAFSDFLAPSGFTPPASDTNTGAGPLNPNYSDPFSYTAQDTSALSGVDSSLSVNFAQGLPLSGIDFAAQGNTGVPMDFNDFFQVPAPVYDTSWNPFNLGDPGSSDWLNAFGDPNIFQSAPGTVNPAWFDPGQNPSGLGNILGMLASGAGKLLFGSNGASGAVDSLGGKSGLLGTLMGGSPGSGAILGALLGSQLGTAKPATSTTTSGPQYSPAEQAARDNILSQAKGIYDTTSAATANGEYPGSKPVTPSAATQDAWSSILGYANGAGAQNSAQLQAAQNFGLNGALDVRNNPYLASAMQAAIRPLSDAMTDSGGVFSSIRTNSQLDGQPGGTRQGIAEGIAAKKYLQQVGDITSKMGSDAYNSGLDTFSKTLAVAPNTQQTVIQPYLIKSGVGTQQEGYTQAQNDYEAAAKNYKLNAPWTPLQNYTNIVYGGSSPSTTTSATANPIQQSPFSNILGGAMMGASLFGGGAKNSNGQLFSFMGG